MNHSSRRICVLGAGVIGLSTALRLRQAGHWVQLISASAHDRRQMTSMVAAAIWRPFRVEEPMNRSVTIRELAQNTLERLLPLGLTPTPAIGVSLQYGHEYFDVPFDELDRPWWSERPELQFAPLSVHDLPEPSNLFGRFVSGVAFSLPIVHMGAYLRFLKSEVESVKTDARGQSQPPPIVGRRVREIGELLDGSEYDAVVNCAGIGAARIANDPLLYPLQGQVVVAPTESGLFKAARKLVIMDTGRFSGEPLYIVPRATHDDVVLGGTVADLAHGSALNAGFDEFDQTHWTPNAAVGRRILARCSVLEPAVAAFNPTDRELVEHYMAVGLRPARSPLRIEADLSYHRPVIHNYGHGGAGLTLSWGSATEVERLLEKLGNS